MGNTCGERLTRRRRTICTTISRWWGEGAGQEKKEVSTTGEFCLGTALTLLETWKLLSIEKDCGGNRRGGFHKHLTRPLEPDWLESVGRELHWEDSQSDNGRKLKC